MRLFSTTVTFVLSSLFTVGMPVAFAHAHSLYVSEQPWSTLESKSVIHITIITILQYMHVNLMQ